MAVDQRPVRIQVTTNGELENAAPAVVTCTDASLRRFVVCCVCGDLLQNPQLLDCLHSCCADCCSAAAVPPSTAKDGGDGEAVRCPICLDATPMRSLRRNDYAAAEVATHRLDSLTAVCCVCSGEDGGNGKQAKNHSKMEVVNWCSRCDKHLCVDCSLWHDRFQKHPRAVVSRTAEAGSGGRPRLWQLVMPVACSEHGAARDAEFYCCDCQRFACTECVRRCVGSGHSLEVAVAAPSYERAGGSKFRGRISADVDNASAALESLRPLLRRHGSDLLANIEAARVADRERLENRRREALQSVASAFDRAVAELEAMYDDVCTEAADLRGRAVALNAKAEYASTYWAELREAAGATCLIGQQALVCARLRTLADGAAALPPALECDRLTMIGRQEKCRADLDKAVAEWIGSPRKLKGNFADVLVNLADNTTGSNGGQQDNNRHAATSECTDAAAPMSLEEALSFESASATISFPVLPDCRDVACTADGRLLVAALREGLLQFDLPSGRQLKTWQPAPRWDGNQDSINVVSVLNDGRVLIGDAGKEVVVMLRRDGDESWLECRRLFPGHGPWSMAVFGAMAAVSGSHVEHMYGDENNSSAVIGVQCSPGPWLVLLSLDTGRKQLELKLDYNITSVALSSSAVVCASQYSVKQSYQADVCFIDCYGFDGQRQWRYTCRELVASVLAVPSAGVIYVSLSNSALVVALSAGDGEMLCDVLAQGRHALAPPRALALCPLSGERGKRRLALAVLTFIEDKVALYRFATV